ncbi:MAG: export transporter periplasmic protein LptC [Pseudomonadota bacterium]|jgi:lipopolysaccharide export system protein LptC|uniref:LPS export ABC transporter periplasmic protein LptC n=1 Tax=Malikia spinosa TaxID=86180 RepID=UPI003223A526
MKLALPLARLHQGWDRAAVYLPVLTMGLLALGSYWILRSAPEPQAPTLLRPATHEPDYFMRGFSVRSHGTDGALLSELSGSQVRHYPDNDVIEIDQARLLALNSSGYTRAEARLLSTDGQQSQYLLEGAVTVERHGSAGKAGPESSMHFAGEQLRVYADGQRIASDLPVELTRNGNRATAQSLRYDNSTGVAELQGRVRAQLSAR